MHGGVPEGHLRFDADDADDTEPGCNAYRVVDQRRFADAGRAGEQDGSGDATLGVTEELIDDRPFDAAADEEACSNEPEAQERARRSCHGSVDGHGWAGRPRATRQTPRNADVGSGTRAAGE